MAPFIRSENIYFNCTVEIFLFKTTFIFYLQEEQNDFKILKIKW